MQTMQTEGRRTAGIGVFLVIIGIVLLFSQQLGSRVDWPIWPIAAGIGLFVVGLIVGGEGGVGFAIAGGIVTMVGVVLGIQQVTGEYSSWAYAWALVAPGGVGLGMTLYGVFTGQWRHVRAGFGAMTAGIAIFLVGFVFFEGVLGIGTTDSDLVSIVAPAAIVVLGLLMLVGAVVVPHLPRDDGWSPSGTASASAFAAGPATADSTADSTAGSTAGPASATGAPVDGDFRTIDLGGATEAEVTLAFGAGRLDIVGPAGPGHLLEGTFRGGARLEAQGPGRIKLTTPTEGIWSVPWDGAPFEWRMSLTPEVPLRLSFETGAARTTADLSALNVTDVRLKSGASETVITLPRGAGMTRVDAEAGAASLRFIVPDGVAARIRSTMALGSTDIDQARFPRDPAGGWASPDYATASNRVELDLRGGVGSVSVR